MAVNLVVRQEKSANTNSNPKYEVYLEQDGEDIIISTYTYNLLRLKADGSFYRYDYIGDDSGFKINTKGKLIESKEE